MPTRRGVMSQCLVFTFAFGVAAGAHAGGCDYVLGSYLNGFMPDFDQKRSPGPLFWDGMQFVNIPAGLPGGGVAYCSPTSHTNVMGYLSQHGFPGLMPGGPIPQTWGGPSLSTYERVTSRIADMGVRMETDPEDGTLCCGNSGAIDYLETYAPGKFVVSQQFADVFYAPTIDELGFHALTGGFVNLMIGWFENTGSNQWKKSGGHVVTMVRLKGWCAGAREVGIRDPGNGNSSLTAQSSFTTNKYTLVQQPGFYNTDDDDVGITVYWQRTYERMLGYDTSSGKRGMINGYRVIRPKAGVTLTPPALPNFNIQVHRPTIPAGSTLPPVSNFASATGTPVRSFALDPRDIYLYYTVQGSAGGPDPRVFRLNVSDGSSQQAYSGVEPSAVAVGRHRAFYIIDRTTLNMIDPDAPAPRGTSTATLPGPVDAIAYDDLTDSLVCLSASAGRYFVYDGRDIDQPPAIVPFPTGVSLAAPVFVATSPPHAGAARGVDSRDFLIWQRGGSSGQIHKIRLNRSGAALEETISDPLFVGAEGLDVHYTQTREHILLARNGAVVEFEKDPATGQWNRVMDSDFAGLPATGGILLSRSRTNYDPETMLGPRYNDELPGTSSSPEWDCPGDADEDGTVGFSDITRVLTEWSSTDEIPADADSSGEVGFGDVTRILTEWGPCR